MADSTKSAVAKRSYCFRSERVHRGSWVRGLKLSYFPLLNVECACVCVQQDVAPVSRRGCLCPMTPETRNRMPTILVEHVGTKRHINYIRGRFSAFVSGGPEGNVVFAHVNVRLSFIS